MITWWVPFVLVGFVLVMVFLGFAANLTAKYGRPKWSVAPGFFLGWYVSEWATMIYLGAGLLTWNKRGR